MKRLSLTFALILMAFTVTFAQFKGSPSKARAYMDKGELANAKGELDAYLNGDKFKKKPKASGYLLQAEIYKAIAISDKEEDLALLDDPVGQALAAFEKVKGMVKENSPEYKKIYDNQGIDPATFQPVPGMLEQFKNHFFQKGADLYNNDQDYTGAKKAFETCYQIFPTDTTAALYAFSCAQQDEDEAGMKKSFAKLAELNYPKEGPYLSMARLHFSKGIELADEDKKDEAKKEYQKMLEMANMGLKAAPSSIDLVKFQIESYIRLDRTDDAINLLAETVKKNPQDSISFFSLGALYDGKGDFEKAEENYKKALEIAPNYYSANLNFAAFYIQRANDIKKGLEDLVGPTGAYTDQAKADKIEAEYRELLGKSLPYLKKCNSLQPDDTEVKDNIESIESILKD
ncbi:MAG: tetratricopeptide repeat protein [Flammeovirgaceae bacterium]